MELPPNLRISTITATSKIDCLVDISKVYDCLEINEYFKYIEFGNQPNKGTSQKHISEKKRKNKKVFFNQITIEVCCNGVTNNIKLFNNGSISMTGIKDIEIGQNSINILFRYLLSKDLSVFAEPEPKIMFFKIVLINSDFKLDFEIKRSELHQILVNDLGIYSSYEPCIYPGVNSKYYWNSKYNDKTSYAIDHRLSQNTLSLTFDVCNADLPEKLRDEIDSLEYKSELANILSNLISSGQNDISPYDININMDEEKLYVTVTNDILFENTSLNERIGQNILDRMIKLEIKYKHKGACYCDGYCLGKGSGCGEMECKKVTVSAFQSGSIIITGANTTRQIYDSYHFINNVIHNNIDLIKKDTTSQKKLDEIIYIKKSSIVYK